MSGGGDPWLLGLNRPMWATRGCASLPAWRYGGLWFRRFVRPIGAAVDSRHYAAFVGNRGATCGRLVFPLMWVEVAILPYRFLCWEGITLENMDFPGAVHTVEASTVSPLL